MRTLSTLTTHGSNVVATTTMVPMRVPSTRTTTMAMPTATTAFVPPSDYGKKDIKSSFSNNVQGHYGNVCRRDIIPIQYINTE